MMQPRIIICTGGQLGSWALEHIETTDVLIGADSGARFLISHGFRPDISIGDFDSVSEEDLIAIRENSGQTIACDPIDKNYTDTEMAVRLALDMQPRELILLGALGTRFDHSLANVHLLALAAAQQVQAAIIDDHNKISLIQDQTTIEKQGFPNVSLLPLSMRVEGITLHGFQYPLTEAELTIGQSLGISNVLTAAFGTIRICEGLLLVIQSRD
ncbi:thiamine diphosphokinase [Paenibacillus sp. FSL H8-0548]|uniref:thiamine diphosphokinase n=1 Tax=Paenibacillus sp. FSL H8-0548 TaxID=1920422 RepID=UPI00096D0F11|nr:thiamine diphosphokinase [Paenibacillus sp. FSL H8-0548]OMF38292.1 thiamine diphosphokinase [Paenibacillus sp. FSL H8-0548]